MKILVRWLKQSTDFGWVLVTVLVNTVVVVTAHAVGYSLAPLLGSSVF